MTFATLCFAGILAVLTFTARAIHSRQATDTAGLCFGMALVAASFLTLA